MLSRAGRWSMRNSDRLEAVSSLSAPSFFSFVFSARAITRFVQASSRWTRVSLLRSPLLSASSSLPFDCRLALPLPAFFLSSSSPARIML